jgi:hypothetical protein
VIWPEKYDPKTSAIYALNDIDVKPMKIRIIIVATCAALAFSMTGPVSVRDGEAITKAFEAAVPNIPGKSLIAVEVNFAPGEFTEFRIITNRADDMIEDMGFAAVHESGYGPWRHLAALQQLCRFRG